MNTPEQSLKAVTTGISAVLGADAPAFTNDTPIGALNIPSDAAADFAQVVSDYLALLSNSEAELACIIHVETGRKPNDTRAMTIGELVQRVARLPDFEG